ncbi:MAG: hypothetical protein JWR37_5364 [Mycobacterium sp.]|jgi:uncharacterized protein YjbJ (UPF0337 family)|nr:hypothetical protein [Mycobacterium sp.]
MTAADKAKNKVDRLTGQAKEKIGKAIGDRRLRNEGIADQAKANLKATGEKVKDALRGRKRY